MQWCGFTAASVLIGCVLASGCSGGSSGGGPPPPTLTPTATATASRSPTTVRTPTATAGPGVAVTGVYPPLGAAAGGSAVLVAGYGFTRGDATTVAFGGMPAADLIAINDRQLSCIAPPGAIGADVGVAVANSAGTGALDAAYHYAGGGSGTTLAIELSGAPSVKFDNQIGTTTVVVDYLVRDGTGVPVEESDIAVKLFVDSVQLGAGGIYNESVLDRDSEELELNVLLLLVLDASYSLQQFNPPQFGPMLGSAQRLVDAGVELWRTRRGMFTWDLVWFDALLSQPDPAHRASFRIANIPVPQPGSFTKLYSAISSALDLSANLLRQGVAAGPRDRHVLVVFTDGQDNLSAFDNRDVKQQGTLTNGDPYPRVGWKATDLPQVFAEIAANPRYPTNLSVHTIALGVSCNTVPAGTTCFDETSLSHIAQVGFGQQLSSADNVAALFDQVRKEFTTLQSSGAKMALPPADYEFRLLAERKSGGASGEVRFAFRVRDTGAEFLGFR